MCGFETKYSPGNTSNVKARHAGCFSNEPISDAMVAQGRSGGGGWSDRTTQLAVLGATVLLWLGPTRPLPLTANPLLPWPARLHSGGGSFLFIKAQAGGAAYHYRAPAQS